MKPGFVALGSVVAAMLFASAAHANILLPWDCTDVPDGAEELRESYFLALQASTLDLLEAARRETEMWRPYYEPETDELGSDEAGMVARYIAWSHLDRFKWLQLERKKLQEAVFLRNMLDPLATLVQNDIAFVLNRPGTRDEKLDELLELLYPLSRHATNNGQPLGAHGLLVQQNGFDVYTMEPVSGDTNGLLRLDVDRDIIEVIDAAEQASSSENVPSCYRNGRLLQIEDAVRAQSQQLRALLIDATNSAPILDIVVEDGVLGVGKKTLGDIVSKLDASTTASPEVLLEQFRSSVRKAIARTDGFLDAAASDVTGMGLSGWLGVPTGDEKRLAQLPVVRQSVLDEHPEYSGIDCIVRSEITFDDARDATIGVVYVGGVAFAIVGAMFGPEIPAAVASAASLLLFGATSADLVARYQELRETEALYFSGGFGSSLIQREQYLRARTAYRAALASWVVQGVATAAQLRAVFYANPPQVRPVLPDEPLPGNLTAIAPSGIPRDQRILGKWHMGRPAGHPFAVVSEAERERALDRFYSASRPYLDLLSTGDGDVPLSVALADVITPDEILAHGFHGVVDDLLRDITTVTGQEAAIILRQGKLYLRLGHQDAARYFVNVLDGEQVLAHTHPTGVIDWGISFRVAESGNVLWDGDIAIFVKGRQTAARIVTLTDAVTTPVPYGETITITTEHGDVLVRLPAAP